MNKGGQEERRPPDQIGPNEYGTKGVQDQMNPRDQRSQSGHSALEQKDPSEKKTND